MKKRMSRSVLVPALALTLILLMHGGSIGQPSKPALPKTLNLATHPVGTMLNAVGTGLSIVLSKHMPTMVKVLPTTGPTEWLPMATLGEVDMGVLNNWDAKMGRLGKMEYKEATGGKGAAVYLLCSGSPALNGVVVSEKSGIKKGSDLKGKTVVGVYSGSAGITGQMKASLANFGLKTTDVKLINVPGVEAGIRAIFEGRNDAGMANIGMAVTSELDAKEGARFLSYDPSPEAFNRMQEHFPCYPAQVKPGPGMIGIREPVYLMGYDFYLVGSEKLSNDTAYAVIKTLWEYDKDLAPIHVRLKDWTRDKYVTTKATIPYHPGVIKFYKEIGAWGADMDHLQRRLLDEK